MKLLLAFGVSSLLAVGAFAQHRGGYNTYGSTTGFGRVLFPGTGHPPAGGQFSITNPGFASHLGAAVNGGARGAYGGYGRGHSGIVSSGYGRIGGIPYAYPVVVGTGGFGYGYDSSYVGAYGQQPPVTVVAQEPAPPQVIINQSFITPSGATGPVAQENDGFHMYQSPARDVPEPQAADPKYYLIAYKDHSIYSALAYWLEDNTLHYVTMQNTHNQASLDLIDLDFTKRLNGDRRVAFSLAPSN